MTKPIIWFQFLMALYQHFVKFFGMEIKPIKLFKPVQQGGVDNEDLLRQPSARTRTGAVSHKTGLAFAQGKLSFDGRDVGKVITEVAQQTPQALAQIAGALEQFKKDSLRRKMQAYRRLKIRKNVEDDEELGHIYALCDAYLAKISDVLKRRYDEKKSGLTLHFDEEGQFILNGMNIPAFIARCRDDPNPKSLTFLRGIRARLGFVLRAQDGNRNYEMIQDVVKSLLDEIEIILKSK